MKLNDGNEGKVVNIQGYIRDHQLSRNGRYNSFKLR